MPTLNKAVHHHNLQKMDLNDNYLPESLSFPSLPHQVNTQTLEYHLPSFLPVQFRDKHMVS